MRAFPWPVNPGSRPIEEELEMISTWDKQFFYEYPRRILYIRKAFPFESRKHKKFIAIVLQLRPGTRKRLIVKYPGSIDHLDSDASCLAFLKSTKLQASAKIVDIDWQ